MLTGIQPIGKTFTAETSYPIPWLSATPYTVEATVKVSANQQDEAGVIVGNYNGTDGMNLEIAEGESQTYYRKNGTHFVPKIKLEDLIIK